MREFCSYGPVDKELHYYVPREALINYAIRQVRGEQPEKGGHYITVWAPRQRGKSWIMQQTLWQLWEDERFDTLKLNLEHLKTTEDGNLIVADIAHRIVEQVGVAPLTIENPRQFYDVFAHEHLRKPLILILDEFDALCPEAISAIVGVFRNIYNLRRDDPRPSWEKAYLLHGVALIGVRAVLGVENVSGSPFNVQQSLHIPNLTFEEVDSMYHWYERESDQMVEQEVIDQVYVETQGQPGLVSWLGELLTDTYNEHPDSPITMEDFAWVYGRAMNVLPNANVLNIISKARQEPYKDVVLNLFRTDDKPDFRYEDPRLKFLYLNGVIDWEEARPEEQHVKFLSPFVQKKLFYYFAFELFMEAGQLYDPFSDLSDTLTPESLNVRNLLRRYEAYMAENRAWLFKDAPRRADLRVYEAVYHFNLYAFLERFFQRRGHVRPEFPTGNGRVDLLIDYAGQCYALEVKSFAGAFAYNEALGQAAHYARQLGLKEITLALFVHAVDEANRAKYEVTHMDAETGVTVTPVFVVTG